MSEEYIVVAGAVNIDIGGKSDSCLRSHDSNPGDISFCYGGVARNIAHNLANWQEKVIFLSAIGKDAQGEELFQDCQTIGLTMDFCVRSNQKSSTYLYISDENGEMQLAISDMKITDNLSPEYFAKHIQLINQSKALVIDANLPEESIRFLAQAATVPIFMDPVSIPKSQKCKNILSALYSFKPNRYEAEVLSGLSFDEHGVEAMASFFLDRGVKNIYLSLGEQGVYFQSENGSAYIKNEVPSIQNATGAGDAFMAALVWAYCRGYSAKEGASLAQKVAALTCQCVDSVNQDIDPKTLV